MLTHSTRRMTAEELITVLLNPPNPYKVCSTQPLSVQQNATFLVNCNRLQSYKDLSADDNGAWEPTGKPCVWFKIIFDKDSSVSKVYKLDHKPPVQSSEVYALYRYYSRHSSSADFRRMIATVNSKLSI